MNFSTVKLTVNHLGHYEVTRRRVDLVNGRTVHHVESRRAFSKARKSDMIDYICNQQGAELNDVVYALSEFRERGHNAADFGIYGGLTFTSFEGLLH